MNYYEITPIKTLILLYPFEPWLPVNHKCLINLKWQVHSSSGSLSQRRSVIERKLLGNHRHKPLQGL